MAKVGVLMSEASALADLDAERLLPVVVELVNHYAPNAPDAIAMRQPYVALDSSHSNRATPGHLRGIPSWATTRSRLRCCT